MIPNMNDAAVWLRFDEMNRKIEVSSSSCGDCYAVAIDNGKCKGEGKGPSILHAIACAGARALDRHAKEIEE